MSRNRFPTAFSPFRARGSPGHGEGGPLNGGVAVSVTECSAVKKTSLTMVTGQTPAVMSGAMFLVASRGPKGPWRLWMSV